MPADKPTELSRIKLKNLNLTARPYDQQALSPLNLTANWISHLALAIYMYTKSPADWMLVDKPTELSRIKLKKLELISLSLWWGSIQPTRPHCQLAFTLSSGDIHVFLLLISMLWQKQVTFELKGYRLSSSAECRIRTQGLRHQIAGRLTARWQTDWAIEDQARKKIELNSRLYDQREFSPLDPTANCF